MSGDKYMDHFKNGFVGGFTKGQKAWNTGLTGEEYSEHYSE
jgi:hypothetical protein